MLVYVKNKNGNNLMPCKPAKARRLLRDKKAKIVNYKPFTIQLEWDCEENVQKTTLGIDKGSHHTGFCIIDNKKVLISGIINHRLDVKTKMDSRRINRRARRNRLWYRKPRFDNRASNRKKGKVLPSIKTNIDEVLRVVNKVPLPISNIIIEDVQIDISKLNNQERKSEKLSENLRLATLMRDGFKCKICGKSKCRLEIHHILPRSKGGKDSISNLITLDEQCHNKIHSGKLKLNLTGVDGFKDRIAQRTMQGKTYLYKELSKIANLSKVYGYQTSELRKELGLDKDHDIDAFCISLLNNKLDNTINYNKDNFFNINFRLRQTRRQYYDLPRKSKGRVKYQVNRELNGFKKGDIVLVRGKYIKQINSIYSNNLLAFKRIKGEPSTSLPKNCKLLLANKSIIIK